MRSVDASRMLRPGLLDGAGVLLAGPPAAQEGGEGFPDAVESTCAALDARVLRCVALTGASYERQEAESEQAVAAALAQLPSIDMLVVDAAALFESERAGGGDPRSESAGAALDG